MFVVAPQLEQHIAQQRQRTSTGWVRNRAADIVTLIPDGAY